MKLITVCKELAFKNMLYNIAKFLLKKPTLKLSRAIYYVYLYFELMYVKGTVRAECARRHLYSTHYVVESLHKPLFQG